VAFGGLNADLMAKVGIKPGVFCAGEMLDWEAPTGGYLMTACLSSGAQAGRGVAAYLAK
jgi:predicted flavoprotein YhiN